MGGGIENLPPGGNNLPPGVVYKPSWWWDWSTTPWSSAPSGAFVQTYGGPRKMADLSAGLVPIVNNGHIEYQYPLINVDTPPYVNGVYNPVAENGNGPGLWVFYDNATVDVNVRKLIPQPTYRAPGYYTLGPTASVTPPPAVTVINGLTGWIDTRMKTVGNPLYVPPASPPSHPDQSRLMVPQPVQILVDRNYNGTTYPAGVWVSTTHTLYPMYDNTSTNLVGRIILPQPAYSPAISYYTGIYGVRQRTFKILNCASDPSKPDNPKATNKTQVYIPGSVPDRIRDRPTTLTPYLNSPRWPGPWGATNYLANYNVLGGAPVGQWGVFAPPRPLNAAVLDGASNTVLLAEGYAWCDNTGRMALDAWRSHNFGITWDLHVVKLSNNPMAPDVSAPFGLPTNRFDHPLGDSANFMFQVRPLALNSSGGTPNPRCTTEDCCNNWTVQTGHSSMNVAFADGTVRSVGRNCNKEVWILMVDPNDNQGFEFPEE
jgi:hypothetical protein